MRVENNIEVLYINYRLKMRQGDVKTAQLIWDYIKNQGQLIREKKINQILND